jgi:hypothetical protein
MRIDGAGGFVFDFNVRLFSARISLATAARISSLSAQESFPKSLWLSFDVKLWLVFRDDRVLSFNGLARGCADNVV